ncbi:hypothetical protein EDC04DRAFT_2914748 [Pisolithus marmoratus]|nr:hypothetical protein EDC04DRAFT_2914748 [Pisolithus marmoratus]
MSDPSSCACSTTTWYPTSWCPTHASPPSNAALPSPISTTHALPPAPPQHFPQHVDYTAQLLQRFNSDHQRHCQQRHNQRTNNPPAPAPAPAPAPLQPGPSHAPPPPNYQTYQQVTNFQHEADQQRHQQVQQMHAQYVQAMQVQQQQEWQQLQSINATTGSAGAGVAEPSIHQSTAAGMAEERMATPAIHQASTATAAAGVATYSSTSMQTSI